MEQHSDGATEGEFATSSAGNSTPALELPSDKAGPRGVADDVPALPEDIDGEPVDAQAMQALATTDEAVDKLLSSSEADIPETEQLSDSIGPWDKESSQPGQQLPKPEISVVIPSPSSKGPPSALSRSKSGPGSPNRMLSRRVSLKPPQNIQHIQPRQQTSRESRDARRSMGEKTLDPLAVPTPPVVVLASDSYQSKGICGHLMTMHLLILNWKQLETPVLETEFKTRFISSPPHGHLNVIVRKVATKGLFLVELSSLVEGTFVFTLLCRERKLKGKITEFTIKMSNPHTAAEMCSAKGQHLHCAIAGRYCTFDILARDQIGSLRSECKRENFAVRFSGPSQCEYASVGEFDKGKIPVTFQINKAGVYKVDISVNDKAIGGSPYLMEVKGGEPVPDKTRVVLEQLSCERHLLAGEPGLIYMCCFDSYGNLNTFGRSNLGISLIHVDHPTLILVGEQVKHKQGLYRFSFCPEVSGKYRVKAEHRVFERICKLDCKQIVHAGPGQVCPRVCFICSETAAGNLGVPTSGVVGQWIEFTIKTLDQFGNERNTQVDVDPVVKVQCHTLDDPDLASFEAASKAIDWEAECHADGTVVVRYAVDYAGRYACQVLIGGEPVADKSFPTRFSPSEIYPANCVVRKAYGFDDALVGVNTSISIEARDRFNNRLLHGNAALFAEMLPDDGDFREADAARARVRDDDSGTYKIGIIPKVSGPHTLTLLYDTYKAHDQPTLEPICDPIKVNVGPASTVSEQATILGETFSEAEAGVEQSFIIASLEEESNTRTTTAGDTFEVYLMLIPGTGKTAKLFQERKEAGKASDGIGPALGRAWQPGGAIRGTLSKGGAIRGTLSKGRSYAANLTSSKPTAGSLLQRLSKAAHARSARFGKRLANVQSFAKEFAENFAVPNIAEEIVLETHVEDLNDGTYEVKYTAKVSGSYMIQIAKNGEVLPFSEGRSTVDVKPGSINGSASVIYGPGTTSAETGVPATFTIQSCDRYGNAVDDGASRFRVEIYKEFVPPEQEEDTLLPVEMKELGGGQCSVTYTAEQAGSYVIEFSLDGKVLPEIETKIMALATNSDRSKCELSGRGLQGAAAGYISSFKIRTHDRFGNPCVTGGDNFVITLQLVSPVPGLNQELPSGPIMLKAQDNKDGTYMVYYRVKVAGDWIVRVTYANDPKGKHLIYEGPVQVVADIPGASRCIAIGAGLSGPAAGVRTEVNVEVHDMYGNGVPLWHKPPMELIRLGKDLQTVQDPADITGAPNLQQGAGDQDEGTVADDALLEFKHYEAKIAEGFFGLVATLTSADAGPTTSSDCTVSSSVSNQRNEDAGDDSDNSINGDEHRTRRADKRNPFNSKRRDSEDDNDALDPALPDKAPRDSSYQIKYSPPRKGLFMLDVKLWGKHILGSPYRVQVMEENILGSFAVGEEALDLDAERALMFARMRRAAGVPTYNRKLGDPTTSGNVASVDTSLITSSVWDESTSSLLKEVGLKATCATAAKRIEDMDRFQRYEKRKQTALLHMRIHNLKHTFESGEGPEEEDDSQLSPTSRPGSSRSVRSAGDEGGAISAEPSDGLIFGRIGDPSMTMKPVPPTAALRQQNMSRGGMSRQGGPRRLKALKSWKKTRHSVYSRTNSIAKSAVTNIKLAGAAAKLSEKLDMKLLENPLPPPPAAPHNYSKSLPGLRTLTGNKSFHHKTSFATSHVQDHQAARSFPKSFRL